MMSPQSSEAAMAEAYEDVDPEEFVTVVSFGPTTLHTAVRLWREASKTPGVRITMVAREAGKDPPSFDPRDLDRLAGLEMFR